MRTGDTRNYVRGRMLSGQKMAMPKDELPEKFQDFLLSPRIAMGLKNFWGIFLYFLLSFSFCSLF
jgi:hypothetical protein